MSNTLAMPVHIRWQIRRDLPEILAIEDASFAFPWYEADFIRCFAERNVISMVGECGEKIVSYMVYALHKEALDVLNFAVHPEYRRRGIGTQMLAKLIGKLSSHRRTRIFLNVRESHLAAQLFFRRQRFLATHVFRAFYATEDHCEDAFFMEYHLPDTDVHTVTEELLPTDAE